MASPANLYGGIETGGTWCVCALGTGPDDVRELIEFPTTSPPETIERIVSFFRAHPAPSAIGIGSFGPVDADPDSPTWGHVTTTPKPGWRHTPLGPVIRERLGLPVAFDTDVVAAAVAEHRWGAGRDRPSLCYVTVGTGIGAGLLVDGRPWHGLVNTEAGHVRIPHDRAHDPFGGVCPSHGDCWEGLASGPAIEQRWGSDPAGLPEEHEAWPLEAGYLASGLLSILLIAAPHRIVIGGGVMEQPRLLAMVRARLNELNAGYLEAPQLGAAIEDYLVAPELGDRAGVLGGIALAELVA